MGPANQGTLTGIISVGSRTVGAEEGTGSWYPEWKFGKRTDVFKKDFMKLSLGRE